MTNFVYLVPDRSLNYGHYAVAYADTTPILRQYYADTTPLLRAIGGMFFLTGFGAADAPIGHPGQKSWTLHYADTTPILRRNSPTKTAPDEG